MEENKDEILRGLVDLLNDKMEQYEIPENQFVVGYYLIKNDKFLGYHRDSHCQLTEDILDGKRYSGDNPYEQLQTINDNLKYVLNSTKENPGFLGLGYEIRNQYFYGRNHNEIYLQAIYLEDGTPKPPIKFSCKN